MMADAGSESSGNLIPRALANDFSVSGES